MKLERLIMSKPYPTIKAVKDGRAFVFSVGKYYFRLSY